MTAPTNPFDRIRVAAPCEASWDEMSGDERSRYCALCQKNVYNLSAMKRYEAEALIREKEGRLCVRFFRRQDGTVLTSDCPVGLAAFRKKVAGFAAGVAALLLTAFTLILRSSAKSPSDPYGPRTTCPTPVLGEVEVKAEPPPGR